MPKSYFRGLAVGQNKSILHYCFVIRTLRRGHHIDGLKQLIEANIILLLSSRIVRNFHTALYPLMSVK